MERREMICVNCPLGCNLVVQLENNQVVKVEGNTCPRGETYAKTECTSPKRVVTSTIRTTDGRIVPVKTDKPILKSQIFECMHAINLTTASGSIKIGDIIIKNVLGTDVNIVATREIN